MVNLTRDIFMRFVLKLILLQLSQFVDSRTAWEILRSVTYSSKTPNPLLFTQDQSVESRSQSHTHTHKQVHIWKWRWVRNICNGWSHKSLSFKTTHTQTLVRLVLSIKQYKNLFQAALFHFSIIHGIDQLRRFLRLASLIENVSAWGKI